MKAANIQLGRTAITLIMTTTTTVTTTTTTTTAITITMTTAITITTTTTTTTTTAITIITTTTTTTTAITIITTTTTTTTRMTMAATKTTKMAMVQRHCQLEFFALRNQKNHNSTHVTSSLQTYPPDNPVHIRDHKENKQTSSHIGRHQRYFGMFYRNCWRLVSAIVFFCADTKIPQKA